MEEEVEFESEGYVFFEGLGSRLSSMYAALGNYTPGNYLLATGFQ